MTQERAPVAWKKSIHDSCVDDVQFQKLYYDLAEVNYIINGMSSRYVRLEFLYMRNDLFSAPQHLKVCC